MDLSIDSELYSTPIVGQVGLGESGGVARSLAEQAETLQTHSVGDNPEPSELPPSKLGGLFHIDTELIDKNHGRYTITKCHALDYFEKHDAETLLKQACEGLCIPYNQRSADWFNPKIKWTAVKLPPRKSKDEPACIWDITLEE